MKKLLFVLVCNIFTATVSAQTRTNYYDYNNNGVPRKVGYSETSSTQSQFAPYVGISKSTLDLYSKIGSQKQQNYDQSIQSIQSSINRLNRLVKKLEQFNVDKSNQYASAIAEVINDLNQGKYDLGRPSVSNTIISWFDKVEDDIINEIAEQVTR